MTNRSKNHTKFTTCFLSICLAYTLTNIFKHIDLQNPDSFKYFSQQILQIYEKRGGWGLVKRRSPPRAIRNVLSSDDPRTKCIHGKKVLAIKHNQTKNVHLDLKMLEEIGRQHEKSSIYSIWDYCTCSLINDSAIGCYPHPMLG